MSVQALYDDVVPPMRDLKGPKGKPIIGHLQDIRRDPLAYFVGLTLNYGDITPIKLGPHRALVLSNPADIKHVMQDNHTNYRKSDFYEVLRPLFGKGILLAESDEWLAQRRVLRPAFQGHRFEHMAQQMTMAIQDMLHDWEKKNFLHGEPFDVADEMMKVTLDVILRTMFSMKRGDEASAIYTGVELMLRQGEQRVWATLPLPLSVPTPANRRCRAALEDLYAIVDRMIDERRREPDRYDDLLAMLIEAYDIGGSQEDLVLLRDQVMNILMAGHETTANAATWTWYLLSKNPHVEHQLRGEIDDVLGDNVPGYEHMSALPFSRMVLEESMRLYPPVWSLSRAALDHDRLGDIDIKPKTTMVLCPYALHRNPKYWPNPEGFDPYRFSEEQKARRPRYAYFPFGGGPRVCLGQHFAMMEAQLILAMVMQRCGLDLLPGQHVEPEPMITLRPRNGLKMVARPRSTIRSIAA